MAAMGNTRHLKAGDPEPEAPAKDVLRVYGMKFCPFTHRLKLVLVAKGVEHETVCINLASKPEWFVANKNPRGQVPVIEKNGVILSESDITSNYIDEVYPGRKLTTADPLKRAQELMVLVDFREVALGLYNLTVKDKEKSDVTVKRIQDNLTKLEAFLKRVGTPYVCGNQVGMTDYMIWPHLERLRATDPSYINVFPNLKAYVDRMGEDGAVKACRHTDEHLNEFTAGYKRGQPNFDIQTVE